MHTGGRVPLLVHIPRTAGTSIRSVCPMPPGASTTLNHATATNWLRMLGLNANRYDLFSVVRHPVGRAWSSWCYLRRQDPTHVYWTSDAAERCALARYATFGQAVRDLQSRLLFLPHFALQRDYTHVNDTCAVRLLRYETLATDWPEFAAEYDLSTTLPHVNAVHNKPDWHMLSNRTIDLVNAIYKSDMEAFNYA